MKSLITDLVGLAGFGGLVAGVYLQFGTAIALMFGGGALLAFALAAARRIKRAT